MAKYAMPVTEIQDHLRMALDEIEEVREGLEASPTTLAQVLRIHLVRARGILKDIRAQLPDLGKPAARP